MTEKDIITAIKAAEQKTNTYFMSWDIGKWVNGDFGGKKSTVSFDVIHEDELDRDVKRRLYRFVEALEEEFLKIPGVKKSTTGFVNDIVVPLSKFDVRDTFYAVCQEEHIKVWGKKAEELDGFSVFL